MENNKDVKRLYFLVTVLAIMVVLLGGFVVYKEFIKEDKNTSDNTKKNDVTCNDCVTSNDLYRNNKQVKILLGNKIRTVSIKNSGEYEKNIIELMIDGKTIQSVGGGLTYFDNLYVLNNEVLMIITTGSDIRSNEYYFYDSNLNKIDVDMTLDSKYPKSMQAFSTDYITVNNNKIIIDASRLTHGYNLVTEKNGYDEDEICDTSGPTGIYKGTHKGELVSAKYEMTYLGNGKFSKFVMIDGTDKYIDETICKY